MPASFDKQPVKTWFDVTALALPTGHCLLFVPSETAILKMKSF